MKKICLSLILWAFTSVGIATTFKVMTFNAMLLCVGPGCVLADSPDLKPRTEGLGPWLAEQKLDLIFLQEIWKKSQFDIVLKTSGMPYGHYFAPDLAMLSRYPHSKPQACLSSVAGGVCGRLQAAYLCV